MTDYRLVDKKGLKTIYGIRYSHQHIARLERPGSFLAGSNSVSVGSPGIARTWKPGSVRATHLTTRATPPSKGAPPEQLPGAFLCARVLW